MHGRSAKYAYPSSSARARLATELVQFYELLDRICLNSSEGGDAEQLTKDLQKFEREIVRLRFSKNDAVKAPVVGLIKAIFADADYFSGLKPLPQYTDVFAYELLFPSWLNLLTASMLPQSNNPKPRLEGQRQGTLFEFLGTVHAAGSSGESELVGFLTFIASRFDAPLCEELLQRLAEIYSREGASVLESIDSIERNAKDARQFARWLHDYLTVKHSTYKWPAASDYPISYKRPAIRVLPESTVKIITELEQSKDNWPVYSKIARRLRFLINSDHLLTNEFIVALQKRPAETADLLRLVIPTDKPEDFLSPESQVCLAFLIDQEAEAGTLDMERILAFADTMAPRLGGYSDATLAFFCRQFLKEPSNRKMMLDACASNEMRSQLAEYVNSKAANTDDDSRFLEWLACVTVISPSEEAATAKATLQALAAVVQNRSIGNKEFSDLVQDLQANVADSMQVLSAPIMAAGGKTPRMASLYMTLNEISETYASTGKAENFSVIRAKYSRLTNM